MELIKKFIKKKKEKKKEENKRLLKSIKSLEKKIVFLFCLKTTCIANRSRSNNKKNFPLVLGTDKKLNTLKIEKKIHTPGFYRKDFLIFP